MTALREKILPRGKKVLLFGAGGAARAIGVELALEGVSDMIILNRGKERGIELTRHIDTVTGTRVFFKQWDHVYHIPEDTDIVINGTLIGLYPNLDAELLLNYDSLNENMVVADGIHNPPKTKLLREAEKRGCKTVNGLEMLVNQAALNFKYWTGELADKYIMYEALTKYFKI